MMKKIMSILTASLFVFALASCSGGNSSVSSSSEPSILTDCKSIGLENINKDPRPEAFDEMNIPSNKEMTHCICEKIIEESPNMTNEELTAFWSDDIDPQSEEAQERMQIMVNCMGFDSMEDFMSAMMETTQK